MEVVQLNSVLQLNHLRKDPSPKSPKSSSRVLLVGNLDYGTGAQGRGINNLPGSAEEILKIKEAAAGKLTAVILEKDQATKSKLLKELAGYRYVHFATHGYLEKLPKTPQELVDKDPLLNSYLALSGANNRPFLDAFFTAHELIGLDLRQTDLVTLSACDAGLGAPMTGQGVLGLQAAVLASGARGMLLSLWKIPDAPTSMLMSEFYAGIWKKGLSKAESLRRAQEAVRNFNGGKTWGNPKNWAGWIFAGDFQ